MPPTLTSYHINFQMARGSFLASCSNLVCRIISFLIIIIEAIISRVISHLFPTRNPPTNANPNPNQEPNDDFPFLTLFESQFGEPHPFFYACRFNEALEIAKDESKLVFMYLHSPDDPYTATFCRDSTLCSQSVVEFLDANFVSWKAVASAGEGLEMATALQAKTFPFYAVIAPDSCEAILVLQKIEGSTSPEELVEMLQSAMDVHGSALRGVREAEEEARREDRRLRQEQDAAFLESLRKDKEKERAKETLQENARESSEKRMKEQKEMVRPAIKSPTNKQKRDSKEIIASRKKPPISRILIKFPDGSRREQTFLTTETIRSIYKYIDSQDLPGIGSYQLISYPRRIFGFEQLDTTLGDAGFHPSAALFLEKL